MKTYANHRKAIEDRLAQMGESKYWLAQQVKKVVESAGGKPVGMKMVYAYLGGKATTTTTFEAICKVLGLKLAYEDGDGKVK